MMTNSIKTLNHGSKMMRKPPLTLKDQTAYIKNQNSLIKIARAENYDLPEPLPIS